MGFAVKMEDYQDGEGFTDWTRYHAAQVAAGEACKQCGKLLLNLNLFGDPPLPGPKKCGACRHVSEDKDEVSHDDILRCPKCKYEWSSHDDDMWEDGIFQEGEHDITCRNEDCGHEFQIETSITYTFRSPALLPEEPVEA